MLADDLLFALDPVAFARSRLSFQPDDWQTLVLRSKSRRVLLNCARQSGKSTIAGLVAVHHALYFPGSLILLISPSQRQSSELFRKVTEKFFELPEQPEKTEDNRLSCTLRNGSRIVSLPSSESTIRGYSGVSLIIEDEAARVSDDLYRAVRPMLAVSQGRLILMSTPFGKRGHFYEEWDKGGAGWDRIEVKATTNPRITREFLGEERRSLGEWWFKQEYLCEFHDAVDQVFSHESVLGALNEEIKPLFVISAQEFHDVALTAITNEVKPLFRRE